MLGGDNPLGASISLSHPSRRGHLHPAQRQGAGERGVAPRRHKIRTPTSANIDYLVRCATIAAPEDLLVAHILRSWRRSGSVCFLRVFCRVCNAVGGRTLDPKTAKVSVSPQNVLVLHHLVTGHARC